ncbi:hypothetical protein H4219_000382 [Mycoemilia scoparia]|uniref:Uncharacterized protein n=1 Tax=Mycoemilia scoparia TaxID=417184 RepID=A0A9W8A6E8_9FUNG|nr:hypothetical protein H4219_000382 [Mycoemilia scoparia]
MPTQLENNTPAAEVNAVKKEDALNGDVNGKHQSSDAPQQREDSAGLVEFNKSADADATDSPILKASDPQIGAFLLPTKPEGTSSNAVEKEQPIKYDIGETFAKEETFKGLPSPFKPAESPVIDSGRRNSHNSTIKFEMEDSEARFKAISEGLKDYAEVTTPSPSADGPNSNKKKNNRSSVHFSVLSRSLQSAKERSQGLARQCSVSYNKLLKPLSKRQNRSSLADEKASPGKSDSRADGKDDDEALSPKEHAENGTFESKDGRYASEVQVDSAISVENPKERYQEDAKEKNIEDSQEESGSAVSRPGKGRLSASFVGKAKGMFKKLKLQRKSGESSSPKSKEHEQQQEQPPTITTEVAISTPMVV